MRAENGQLSVPPGFRFHPTDEELLYYYLRKKVSCEAIDLDVIKEVDLNKLEPWDLKDKCRVGSGLQHEWYFFSHKDKKYPTGTRTNRATTAGFWKATGRDKAIHHHNNCKRIGLRKTLVFYVGRAPHGQKTDWIMHEYRLDDEYSSVTTSSEIEVQEDGWVVCRVFKKINHNRNPFQVDDHLDHTHNFDKEDNHLSGQTMNKHGSGKETLHSYNCNIGNDTSLFDGSMHLPQLLPFPPKHISYISARHQSLHSINNNVTNKNNSDNIDNLSGTMMVNGMDCSKDLLSLMSTCHGAHAHHQPDKQFFGTSNVITDWSFLDKLLASDNHHHGLTLDLHNQHGTCNNPSSSQHYHPSDVNPSSNIYSIQNHLGYESDVSKIFK